MTDITQSSNPLLTGLRIPGETFRLPSQGLFYSNGEVSADVKNGEVHVYPMTTIDEIAFKTPDMLFTGNVVDEVFARCIPQIKNARNLLAKDVDYLLACLRMITYGPTITLVWTHDCENAKQHEYVVELRPIISQAKAIDPTSLARLFTVTLDNGQVVKLKPATFGSIMSVGQTMDVTNTIPSIEDLQKSIVSVIVDMVVSVDDVTDKKLIKEWVEQLPAGWTRQITAVIEQMGEWGASFSSAQVCKDCGNPISLEFSTNPISFFS